MRMEVRVWNIEEDEFDIENQFGDEPLQLLQAGFGNATPRTCRKHASGGSRPSILVGGSCLLVTTGSTTGRRILPGGWALL
jgi:hypothetical protein